MDIDHQISSYDRIYGGLVDNNSLHTKPRTIKDVDFLGRAETFIIETVKTDEGYVIFLECVNPEGHFRVKLPPTVVRTFVQQQESLASRSRRSKAKEAMKVRIANGYVPTFAKK